MQHVAYFASILYKQTHVEKSRELDNNAFMAPMTMANILGYSVLLTTVENKNNCL